MIDRPLRCMIEEDELVIRIGINTLGFAANQMPPVDRWNKLVVADASIVAQDVCGQLNREEEDGTTPIHILLDKAIVDAWADGSIGFEETE